MNDNKSVRDLEPEEKQTPGAESDGESKQSRPREIGGPKGPEPTRYGDWERNGRCTDF